MKIKVEVYNEMKYTTNEKPVVVFYDGVKSWEVKTIPADVILKETDGSCVDEYNEYFIITFEDGDTATFRNSHVDAFRA